MTCLYATFVVGFESLEGVYFIAPVLLVRDLCA